MNYYTALYGSGYLLERTGKRKIVLSLRTHSAFYFLLQEYWHRVPLLPIKGRVYFLDSEPATSQKRPGIPQITDTSLSTDYT